jgi:hypothetical protein
MGIIPSVTDPFSFFSSNQAASGTFTSTSSQGTVTRPSLSRSIMPSMAFLDDQVRSPAGTSVTPPPPHPKG